MNDTTAQTTHNKYIFETPVFWEKGKIRSNVVDAWVKLSETRFLLVDEAGKELINLSITDIKKTRIVFRYILLVKPIPVAFNVYTKDGHVFGFQYSLNKNIKAKRVGFYEWREAFSALGVPSRNRMSEWMYLLMPFIIILAFLIAASVRHH